MQQPHILPSTAGQAWTHHCWLPEQVMELTQTHTSAPTSFRHTNTAWKIRSSPAWKPYIVQARPFRDFCSDIQHLTLSWTSRAPKGKEQQETELKSGAVPTQPLSLTPREANYNTINRNKPCAQLQHCPRSPVTQDVT